ncbi:MAG: N-acetyl-gamma-glutamyl-phosphate reductase [Actinobacteria bacterium]|nr:N-acetyl-gamma-glutamyl-phosphate reductase [Actinomycetota bacterium]
MKNYISRIKGIIIDLGADFRITNPEDFKKWYGEDHILPEFLPLFVYGLPEINRDKIRGSRYIANPGCYPTSILLGLAPILSERDFQVEHIVIDSKSGVTGAGRKLKPEYLFLSVNENFLAYSAVCHRHIGEIEQEIEKISGKKHKICFTPHLLPLNRGIFTSIYCHIRVREKEGQSLIDTKDTFDNQDKALFKEIECDKEFHINGEEVINIKGMIKGMLTKRLYSLYQNFYKDSLFVRFLGERIPQIKDVVGTNMCHIGIAFDERTCTLKIFSAIDNLLKGASGQAVQNMNIAMGLDEMEGLAISGIFS